MVQHPEREDCYIARLVVKKVSPADSRRYFLHVENAHGTDRYAVELNVKGKSSSSKTSAAASACGANSILKFVLLVFQNLSPWPPSSELSSLSLFFLSFWSSFFYTPTKNKSSVLKVSFAYFFWIGKKPLTFISVDCSVGFYMSHFLPSAKMSSLGNYRFPICFYCVCTFFIKRELICSWSYDHIPNPWLKIDNNERHNTEKKIHYSMMIESLP